MNQACKNELTRNLKAPQSFERKTLLGKVLQNLVTEEIKHHENWVIQHQEMKNAQLFMQIENRVILRGRKKEKRKGREEKERKKKKRKKGRDKR